MRTEPVQNASVYSALRPLYNAPTVAQPLSWTILITAVQILDYFSVFCLLLAEPLHGKVISGGKMQSEDEKQRKRNAQFAAFRSGDADDLADIVARMAIIMVCGVALWLATGQIVMLVWCFGYSLMNVVFVFGFLRRKSGDATKCDLILCACASSLVSAWYCGMLIYIATLGDGDFVLLAACGVLGLALHCLSRNVEFSYSAIVDFLAVTGTGLSVTIISAWFAATPGGAALNVLGGLCSCVYFFVSFRQIISVNRTLAAKSREEIQNQKMLALGQLASGVAHDFNNLLTVINGNIELVMQDPDNLENQEFLSEAKAASDKSARLVRQLLAYGRKSDLRLSKVALCTVFASLDALWQRVLPANIQLDVLDVSIDADLFVDRTLLESALMNLIINAQKAIGDQPGHIRLCASQQTKCTVRIKVTDSGAGMTPDVLFRASEPFFTTRPVGQGSGLGLSMVKGFASQSGGNLDLSNLEGGGFQAAIELPVSGPVSGSVD